VIDYEFSITDESGLEVASGGGSMPQEVARMAFNYYSQYLQDGPHTLRIGPYIEPPISDDDDPTQEAIERIRSWVEDSMRGPTLPRNDDLRLLLDIVEKQRERHNLRPPSLDCFADEFDELDARRDFMRREGYRMCDIPACNCNSWHGRGSLLNKEPDNG